MEEREAIGLGLAREEPFAEIAGRLGRPTSTVSREMAAGGGRQHYRATAADRRALGSAQRRRPKQRKLVSSQALAARVAEGLEQRWPAVPGFAAASTRSTT